MFPTLGNQNKGDLTYNVTCEPLLQKIDEFVDALLDPSIFFSNSSSNI